MTFGLSYKPGRVGGGADLYRDVALDRLWLLASLS